VSGERSWRGCIMHQIGGTHIFLSSLPPSVFSLSLSLSLYLSHSLPVSLSLPPALSATLSYHTHINAYKCAQKHTSGPVKACRCEEERCDSRESRGPQARVCVCVCESRSVTEPQPHIRDRDSSGSLYTLSSMRSYATHTKRYKTLLF